LARPDRLVLVLGTGTEVGKTWVTAELVLALAAGPGLVRVRKPVQSFAPGEGRTDAEVLAGASGEPAAEVCPPHRSYPLAMAAPMAAEALRRPPFTISDLVGETTWPDAVRVGLVEGAGGVRSPLAVDGDCVDLVHAMRPDAVVLVADAGLGTLNLVRLSTGALAGLPVLVHLNRFDPTDDLHRRNKGWIERDGLQVETSVPVLARRLASCACRAGPP
jgi:dethiobiotin synthetase